MILLLFDYSRLTVPNISQHIECLSLRFNIPQLDDMWFAPFENVKHHLLIRITDNDFYAGHTYDFIRKPIKQTNKQKACPATSQITFSLKRKKKTSVTGGEINDILENIHSVYTSIRKVKKLKTEIFLHARLNVKRYFSSLLFQKD